MSTVDEIAEHYVTRFAELNPVGASTAGISGYDHLMTDLGPAGMAALADLDRDTSAALTAASATTVRELVAKQAMLERLAVSTELYDSGATTSELNVIASWVQGVRQVFDLMPTDGEEAQQNLAARMAAVPAAYAGLRRTYRQAAAHGNVAARRQVEACAAQCANWSARGAGFYSGLVERTHATGTIRAELDRAAVA